MGAHPPKILAVDDDSKFLEAIRDSLKDAYDVTTAIDGTAAMRNMSQSLPDLVLQDFCMPQISGFELLKIFKRRFPDVPVIMLTAEKDADTIIETMKNGASDFVIKATEDFETNLKFRIAQAIEKLMLQRKNQELRNENISRTEENRKLSAKILAQTKDYEILGISTPTLKLKHNILALRGTRSTVLITGENGTGKELVARTLNRQDDDHSRPFIDLNCAAINQNLFESEFFGHVKGSFTGATDNKDGKFKMADGGDLFLDEVGELSLEMQAKLLRVIQEKTFTPVGSTKSITVDVRVIAATNRSLEDEISNGRFREDLYYRLSPICLHVPSLRERKPDIIFLAEEFLKKFLPAGKLSEPTKQRLEKHSWPGNIRELHNIIERAAALAKGSHRPLIKPEHILLSRTDSRQSKMIIPERLIPRTASDVNPAQFEESLHWMEREYLKRGLEVLGGDNEALYKKLDVSRAYYFKRKKIVGLLGDRMVGKSAHGRTEKFGYYEHSWATVKGSYVPGLKCQCAPYRVLAKKLEPVGWAEIMKLLTQKEVAEELLASARRAHQINPASREVEKCNQTVFTVDRQLEVLAERLASLPQTISPTPVYRQMEKLEFQKKAALAKLTELNETGVVRDEPSDLKSFEKFTVALREMLASNDDSKVKAQIVRALIRKILITPDGAEFYFKVGETHVKSLTHQFTKSAVDFSSGRDQKKNGSHSIGSQADAEQNLRLVGSNTCLSGTRDRT